MNSKELLSYISTEDIVDMLVNYYDIEMDNDTDPMAYHFRSDCHNEHNEGNFKLYLFKDSKMFHCYSCCGQMSLFDFIMTMENIEFAESVDFVQDFFNINTVPKGFGRKKKPKKEFVYVRKEVDYNEVLTEYDSHILNTFVKYYPIEWLHEDISKETMDKYNILFSMEDEAIIMPHYDINNRLIGIRQRNLSEYQLRLKRKYVPHTSMRSRITYKHSLGKNLFGLNINKNAISKSKRCILFESEKSVLKADSYFGENSSVAVGGSTVSEYQLNLLKQLGCEIIYVAFDKESLADEKWNRKMNRIYTRIVEWGFKCFIISDTEGLLEEKDSPIDRGEDVFLTLLSQAKEFIKVVDEK